MEALPQVWVCDTRFWPFPKEDGFITMENGVISVCMDTMGHLISLQLMDSKRSVSPSSWS